MADDIKDDVTEDQVQADQAQAEEDQTEIEDAPSDDEEWTEEDMRLLSDEERAALFGDDEGTGDADETDEGDDQGEPAAQATGDDTAQDDTDIIGTQVPDLAALDAEIEALDAAKVAALDEWEEGNLSRDEYLAKLAEIDAVSKETIAQRAVAEAQEQAVYESFIGTAKSYFGEFPALATKDHAEAYDRHVRSVTGNPAYQHMTHRQMLEAAHKLYAAEAEVLGVADVPAPEGKAKAAPAPAPEAKAADPAPARKPRPGDKAPVTLRNVPNAAPVSASDGKYSSLAQRLESASAEEYERILGSMSPDEAEAFASMDV